MTSCPGCHDGHHDSAIVEGDDLQCILCGRSLSELIRKRLTLRNLTEQRIKEVKQLLDAYDDLRHLGCAMRATLLPRCISAIREIQAFEAMELPEASGDLGLRDDDDDDDIKFYNA